MPCLKLKDNTKYEVPMFGDITLSLTEAGELAIDTCADSAFALIMRRHGWSVLISQRAIEVNGHKTCFKILRHLDQIRVGSTTVTFLDVSSDPTGPDCGRAIWRSSIEGGCDEEPFSKTSRR